MGIGCSNRLNLQYQRQRLSVETYLPAKDTADIRPYSHLCTQSDYMYHIASLLYQEWAMEAYQRI